MVDFIKKYNYSILVIHLMLLIILSRNSILVRGDSMNPTLKHNNLYLTCKYSRSYKVGDIVTFEVDKEKRRLVKRIVAMEGDYVEVIENNNQYEILINGEHIQNTIQAGLFPGERIEVEENHVYVLGDNTNNSVDSRFLGSISLNFVKSKVFIRSIPVMCWSILMGSTAIQLLLYLSNLLKGGSHKHESKNY